MGSSKTKKHTLKEKKGSTKAPRKGAVSGTKEQDAVKSGDKVKKQKRTPELPGGAAESKVKKVKKEEKIEDKKDAAKNEQEVKGGAPRPSTIRDPSSKAPLHRVTFKSNPDRVDPFTTPSPRTRAVRSESNSSAPASPAVSLENLKQWKEDASKAGLSLEDFMEAMSRDAFEKGLEDHMNKLMEEQAKEAEAAKEKGKVESSESEDEKPEPKKGAQIEEMNQKRKTEKSQDTKVDKKNKQKKESSSSSSSDSEEEGVSIASASPQSDGESTAESEEEVEEESEEEGEDEEGEVDEDALSAMVYSKELEEKKEELKQDKQKQDKKETRQDQKKDHKKQDRKEEKSKEEEKARENKETLAKVVLEQKAKAGETDFSSANSN